MGLSSKKSTSKGTETQNTTSTATTHNEVPDWIKNPTMQVAGNIGGILAQGPGAYAPQTSGLQRQAFDTATGLKNSDYLRQAGDTLGGVGDIRVDPITASNAEAQSLLTNLSGYYNPFKEQITNPVLSDYDVNADRTRAAQAAAAARNRSFQGSRYGIQEAATEGELARGRAATEGGLLSDMFKTSTGLSASDAERRQQAAIANAAAANAAAQSNANLSFQSQQANQAAALQRAQQLAALGLSEGGETRANLGVQAGLGGILTDQENAARQYPITFAGQTGQLLQGLNPELYTDRTVNSSGTMTGTSTNTTKQGGSLLEGLGQAAQIAALFAGSDERLKQDIETVGYDAKGHRWVTFAYIWAPLKRVLGVIAQEVRRITPEAVMADEDGYLMVNYGALS